MRPDDLRGPTPLGPVAGRAARRGTARDPDGSAAPGTSPDPAPLGPDGRPGLARARRDLAAATLLAAHGYAGQAVAAAAHAALDAAQVVLAALDESRDQPSDVVSAFVRRVVRERAMDPATGRALRSLVNRAAFAERTWAEAPAEVAQAALADATTVLERVTEWLDDPARSAPRAGEATRRNVRPLRRRRASET